VLTISDGVAEGSRQDESGELLAALLGEEGYEVSRRVVPDDRDAIAEAIAELAEDAVVVLTTGGTGLGPRDVTPEATVEVLERHAPGIAEALRADSIAKTPHGLLSRGVAGVVGRTLVVNSGSHGKFLSRLDLDVRGRRVVGHRYRLLPVLASALPEDSAMASLVREIRAPHAARLGETLAVSESVLYRRGNFNGSFDEMILDALLRHSDAEVAFSPGFRWGRTVLPGQAITLEDVYSHTALTYPNTWTRELTGAEVHAIMEDVADNLFHRDPYYRQGGDMVRLGGLTYAIDPERPRGRRIREATGPPAWDVVADYLRSVKRVRIDARPRVRVG
jgi:molybdenum cofactor synthesis domain-containing protein